MHRVTCKSFSLCDYCHFAVHLEPISVNSLEGVFLSRFQIKYIFTHASLEFKTLSSLLQCVLENSYLSVTLSHFPPKRTHFSCSNKRLLCLGSSPASSPSSCPPRCAFLSNFQFLVSISFSTPARFVKRFIFNLQLLSIWEHRGRRETVLRELGERDCSKSNMETRFTPHKKKKKKIPINLDKIWAVLIYHLIHCIY